MSAVTLSILLAGIGISLAAADDCTKFQYWNGTKCVACSGCTLGYGVKSTCSSKQDTECQPCLPGYDYSNTTGFDPCILCNTYSNCHDVNAKKIKDCTIFSPPICEGCADGFYFHPGFKGCTECSSPCRSFEDETRPCTNAHDRKCTVKSTIPINRVSSNSSMGSAKEIPNSTDFGGTEQPVGPELAIEVTPSPEPKTPTVKSPILWGGVCAGLVAVAVAISVFWVKRCRRAKRRTRRDSDVQAGTTRGNNVQMQQTTLLIKPRAEYGLDLPIKDLTIVGKRFIARRLNGKDNYGYFYWQITAEKLGLTDECRAWEAADNPTEKMLTAYGEIEGSTIRNFIKALREAKLTHFANEMEQQFSIKSTSDQGEREPGPGIPGTDV